MKKKIIVAILIIAVAVVGINVIGPTAMNKIGKENVITSSQLEMAIDISEFSTA